MVIVSDNIVKKRFWFWVLCEEDEYPDFTDILAALIVFGSYNIMLSIVYQICNVLSTSNRHFILCVAIRKWFMDKIPHQQLKPLLSALVSP